MQGNIITDITVVCIVEDRSKLIMIWTYKHVTILTGSEMQTSWLLTTLLEELNMGLLFK